MPHGPQPVQQTVSKLPRLMWQHVAAVAIAIAIASVVAVCCLQLASLSLMEPDPGALPKCLRLCAMCLDCGNEPSRLEWIEEGSDGGGEGRGGGELNAQRATWQLDAETSRINAAFKIYDIYSSRHGEQAKRVAGILLSWGRGWVIWWHAKAATCHLPPATSWRLLWLCIFYGCTSKPN